MNTFKEDFTHNNVTYTIDRKRGYVTEFEYRIYFTLDGNFTINFKEWMNKIEGYALQYMLKGDKYLFILSRDSDDDIELMELKKFAEEMIDFMQKGNV